MAFLGLGGAKVVTPQLQQAATEAQAQQSYGNTQGGLDQQLAFIHALQAQNGIQNQSDVYGQLGQIAQGAGPNPAQAMLANSTGANVANQAALMAGQRGAGANPALIARQAAMQGGALQQQAAGQGAAMQAQQQLAAIDAMGGIAGQQVGQQATALQGYQQGALGQQQSVYGAIGNQNNTSVAAADSQNRANSEAQKSRGAVIGSLINAAGGVAAKAATGGAAPAAHGGVVNQGQIGSNPPASGPQSMLGRALMAGGGAVVPGKVKHEDNLKNDKVSAMLSPGEIVIPVSIAQGKDPAGESAKFVAAIMSKRRHGKK